METEGRKCRSKAVCWLCEHQPARRQRYPHEGLVRPQLSMQLHEVFLLPLDHPGKLTVLQLNPKHCWQGLNTHTTWDEG